MIERSSFAAILACALLALNDCHKPATPLTRAYDFLYAQMDRYAQGEIPRLVQSYVPTAAFSEKDNSYVYDDSLVILALLRRGRADDVRRARLIGDALLSVQAGDAAKDGRLRSAYRAGSISDKSGMAAAVNAETSTGNIAWAGIALAQLCNATGDRTYLSGARAAAKFIKRNAYDTRGAGGYTGGLDSSGKRILYKSTEHNIDVYAFFTMLAALTHDPTWRSAARHALTFVRAMWNDQSGRFEIGSGLDGVSVNRSNPVPEDVQTWSFLATGLAEYRRSLDWAVENLSAVRGRFRGLSFENGDRSGVWFEGTAHAAAALEARGLPDDADKAEALLGDIETGQANAPNADGKGIDAASKDGLRTGDGAGDRYYAALHIGATAWYCLAKQPANPFRLFKRPSLNEHRPR